MHISIITLGVYRKWQLANDSHIVAIKTFKLQRSNSLCRFYQFQMTVAASSSTSLIIRVSVSLSPSGPTSQWTAGPPRCCAGPTLPPPSQRPLTRDTAPCCMTTATCRRPWARRAPTPRPTPTRPAPGTPTACCPARTRAAPRPTSPSRSGYVSRRAGLTSECVVLERSLQIGSQITN